MSPVPFSNSDSAEATYSPVSPLSEDFVHVTQKISDDPMSFSSDSPVSPLSESYAWVVTNITTDPASFSPDSPPGLLSEEFEHVSEEIHGSPSSYFSDGTDASETYCDIEEHPEETLPDCKCPPDRMDFHVVPTLPDCIAEWILRGESACTIGIYLHRFVYGQDATLNNLVTVGVDSGKAYSEIGLNVIRNLNLRDIYGYRLLDIVEIGDETLLAPPELWRMPLEERVVFAQAIGGMTIKDFTHSILKHPHGTKRKSSKSLIVSQRKSVRFDLSGLSRRASICEVSDAESID